MPDRITPYREGGDKSCPACGGDWRRCPYQYEIVTCAHPDYDEAALASQPGET